MGKVKVRKNPDEKTLETMGVGKWPIWNKEVSEFEWFYDEDETFYVLEGEASITEESGEVHRIEKGDLVTCKKDLRCTWKVTKFIKKHYNFG
jgi:uncharacterized cupin superfamily protein